MPDTTKALDFTSKNIRLWHGEMSFHDALWFATRDVDAISFTGAYIHNLALTYAVSGFSYVAPWFDRPRYDEDLANTDRISFHALPTKASVGDTIQWTHNAIDDLTGRTDTGPRTNLPKLGGRVCLPPSTGSHSRCELWVFGHPCAQRPPGAFRLGKKGCPVRVEWTVIGGLLSYLTDDAVGLCHVLSPRDIISMANVVSYRPVATPPHFLCDRATVRHEWVCRVQEQGQRFVHVPKRVLQWAGIPT